MEEIATATYSFEKLRRSGYVYGEKRPVTLVGVNFRTAKRNIDEPVISAFR